MEDESPDLFISGFPGIVTDGILEYMVSPIIVSTTVSLSFAIFVTCLSYKGYSPKNLRDFVHATPRPFPRGQAVEIQTAPEV